MPQHADGHLGQGEYGAIPKWFHLECAKWDEILVGYAKSGDAKLKNVVLGWDALTKDECLGENSHQSGKTGFYNHGWIMW